MPSKIKRIVRIFEDGEELALGARDWLLERLTEDQEDASKPFTIALSGGSTPKRLYQLLGELPQGKVDWTRIRLIWGDERNVAQDHPDSNFGMVKNNLLNFVPIPSENVLSVRNPGGDPELAAREYEQDLKNAGIEHADVVLLGIGDDVHTASLFPETKALQVQNRLVVENWVPKLDCWRITLSASFINQSRRVAFLIGGSAKTEALHTLWHGTFEPEQFPAQLIQPESGTLDFLLDAPAIDGLRPPQPHEIIEAQ